MTDSGFLLNLLRGEFFTKTPPEREDISTENIPTFTGFVTYVEIVDAIVTNKVQSMGRISSNPNETLEFYAKKFIEL